MEERRPIKIGRFRFYYYSDWAQFRTPKELRTQYNWVEFNLIKIYIEKAYYKSIIELDIDYYYGSKSLKNECESSNKELNEIFEQIQ